MTGKAPLCLCGCGNQVTESAKFPGTWNKFYSRHGKARPQEQFKTPPKCKCGCGKRVTWRMFGGGWRAYAEGCVPNISSIPNHVTKQELMEKLEVSSRTIERRVKREVLPEPLLVKVPNKPQLQVVFLIKDLISFGVIEVQKDGRRRWSKTT